MKKLSCFLGFICIAVAFSADTTDIESLRLRVQGTNAELTASEKGVISKFWSTALDQMLLTKMSVECVDVRRQLAEQKGSDHLSYYATDYIAEANNSIEAAFSDAQRMEDAVQREMIKRNLMILTAELKSPALAPLALQRIGDEDDVMRYWAVKALAAPAVIGQLTSDVTGDEAAIQDILTAFQQRISLESQNEILKMMTRFCTAFDDPTARDILVAIADRRIKAYRDWTVSDEALEVTLLRSLGNVAMLQQDPAKKLFGQKFAELYAAVIQRYLKGKNVLPKAHVEKLKTVMAEIDQNVLLKTMNVNTGILQGIKTGKGLEREYETLFGDRVRPGKLATIFKFDYGKDASGKAITAPQDLAPMPEKIKG